MKRPVAKTVNIFLTADKAVANNYFNKHDPAPVYMRQLSHEFEAYIMESVKVATRYSAVFYKLKCGSEDDKQYAEPLMYAIRRHFAAKKDEAGRKFLKFRKRNLVLLAISIVTVITLQALLPLIFNATHGISIGIINSIDIFAWVLLWHPIDELVFRWNSFLKEISVLNKLATAESILVENEKQYATDDVLKVA